MLEGRLRDRQTGQKAYYGKTAGAGRIKYAEIRFIMTRSLSEYPADYSVPDLKGHRHAGPDFQRRVSGQSASCLVDKWSEGIGKSVPHSYCGPAFISSKNSEESLFNDDPSVFKVQISFVLTNKIPDSQ